VLRAPTGAGKTTRVPPALLRGGLATDGQILLLQPRRVATRAAAARMAAENGWRLGREVGYRTRFERQVGPETKILVVTEGVLLSMLRSDPFLEPIATIVFDEFHERNLASELALGMVRQIRQSVRPELRTLVMSATLDPGPVARYLDDCPILQCAGRLFPVDIRYLNAATREPIARLAARGVEQLLDHCPGDLLVFLPGTGEIRETRRLLREPLRDADVQLLDLYGDLPAERQDAVLQPAAGRRVILATNVAETSLTIPGVTAVVDSGWARQLRYDARVGLDRLQLIPVSQASADQRAGRAGRTAPGICLRLWSAASHRSRPPFDQPEVRRADLCGTLLQLLCWIEPQVPQFPWFEQPPADAVRRGLHLLRRLDAADERGVTPLGRRLAGLPVHPRLARLLIEARRLGCLPRAALAAALLSERSPFLRQQRARPAGQSEFHSTSDILDQIAVLEAWQAGRATDEWFGPINRGAARFVFRVRDQLVQRVAGRSPRRADDRADDRAGAADDADEALLRALLAAFPDRLARRRQAGSRRGLMVGGRGVRLADESHVLDGELFLCLDVDDRGTEALVRRASFVQRAWLAAEHLSEQVDVAFDPDNRRVAARRRISWEDLPLDEAVVPVPDDARAAEILCRAAREDLHGVFPGDDPAVEGFLARARWLGNTLGDPDWPRLDDDALRELLPELCTGCRSFAAVRKADWLTAIKGLFRYDQLQLLDREAPETLTVPSGRRVALRYAADKTPILAVRIQEIFGLDQTPRVARGRVPVLLHLLAPNMRVQQVTDDLESFWNNTYQVIRKELRGRYPKHAWPEDPR
jgi:ATP-dependent helicase HrpB